MTSPKFDLKYCATLIPAAIIAVVYLFDGGFRLLEWMSKDGLLIEDFSLIKTCKQLKESTFCSEDRFSCQGEFKFANYEKVTCLEHEGSGYQKIAVKDITPSDTLEKLIKNSGYKHDVSSLLFIKGDKTSVKNYEASAVWSSVIEEVDGKVETPASAENDWNDVKIYVH